MGSRVEALAGELAVRMLSEAGVQVSAASLPLVMTEATALAGSVILMEDLLARARHRIAELAAVSGAARPRVVDFDPSQFAVCSPASN
jgi:hypothetical protein